MSTLRHEVTHDSTATLLDFQGIFQKTCDICGIDIKMAGRADQEAWIVHILPSIRAESRPPGLHFIRILQTVSPHCISSAIPLQRCEIWLRRETLTAPITQQDVLIIRLGDYLEAQSPSETFVWSSPRRKMCLVGITESQQKRKKNEEAQGKKKKTLEK